MSPQRGCKILKSEQHITCRECRLEIKNKKKGGTANYKVGILR